MKKYLLILVFSVAGLLLSGCHPCMLVQCGSWVRAEAFVGDDGEVYVDIPDRSKYQSTELHSISVYMLRDDNGSVDYWASMKSLNSEMTRTDKGDDFPIKYGVDALGAISDIKPKKLENGRYIIRGAVFLTNNERETYNIAGEFVYKYGVIHNVK